MWTPIFKQNKSGDRELEEYISNLTHFKELLIRGLMTIYEDAKRQ
jgi:uncharacterized pyridoxal phosphate-containing UPF0001 family protein